MINFKEELLDHIFAASEVGKQHRVPQATQGDSGQGDMSLCFSRYLAIKLFWFDWRFEEVMHLNLALK